MEAQKQLLEQQQQAILLKQQHQQPPPSLLSDLAQNPQQIIPSLLNNVNVNMLMSQNNLLQNLCAAQNQTFQNPPHNIVLQQQQQQQQQFQQQQQQEINQQFLNFTLPPPNFSIPDLSRPPPNFGSTAADGNATSILETTEIEIDLTPTMPYFKLPAGLTVPLIRLEDYSYHSIDSENIKLPSQSMASEKLINAIEAFYAAPSHERPRDNEGWEKLGLYEYFKVKNAVKKQKEEAIARFEREKSRSPTPLPETLIKPAKKLRKRVYRSKSPEKRSKSRSISPEPKAAPAVKQQRQQQQQPRSKARSRSPSPVYRSFNREPRNERARKRSITPPSFSVAANRSSEFIDDSNKGHQLLKKLGWQGSGLGAGKYFFIKII